MQEIVAVVDTREQRPVSFQKMKSVVKGLKTGDYSVVGLEDYVTIERKADIDEFVSCVGGERSRFDREIQRMKPYPVKAIVVGCTFQDLIEGNWRPQVSINAVIGSFIGWQAHGVPIILAGHLSHEFIEWFLRIVAKRRFKEIEESITG